MNWTPASPRNQDWGTRQKLFAAHRSDNSQSLEVFGEEVCRELTSLANQCKGGAAKLNPENQKGGPVLEQTCDIVKSVLEGKGLGKTVDKAVPWSESFTDIKSQIQQTLLAGKSRQEASIQSSKELPLSNSPSARVAG